MPPLHQTVQPKGKAPVKVSDAGLDTDAMDAERLAATAERPYVFLHDSAGIGANRAPLPAEIREPLRVAIRLAFRGLGLLTGRRYSADIHFH